jgi:hypothetical protein
MPMLAPVTSAVLPRSCKSMTVSRLVARYCGHARRKINRACAFMAAERKRWEEVIRDAGITFKE